MKGRKWEVEKKWGFRFFESLRELTSVLPDHDLYYLLYLYTQAVCVSFFEIGWVSAQAALSETAFE